MTFLNTDKMKISVLVVTFLLLASAFAFLPAVGAFAPTTVAKDSPAPATVSGVTATIDSPVLVGSAVTATRTISVSNPIGNNAISSITISIPVAAVEHGQTPTGGYVAGAPGSATFTVFGSGPWALVYSASTTDGILVPGGATVEIYVTFPTELSPTTTGVADQYSLAASVTDTTGATTNLNSITIYETGATASITLTGPTTTPTAGSDFTVTATSTVSGFPLQVSASGTSSDGSGTTSKTTTISPSTFTSSSSAQSLTLNDTTMETLTVTVNGGTLNTADDNTATITQSVAVSINAGPVSTLSVTFSDTAFTGQGTWTSTTQPKTLNATSLTAIPGSDITVATSDKFGNSVSLTTQTSLTISAITLSGQSAGFSTGSYGTTYPYTPTPTLSPSLATIVIPANTPSTTLGSNNFFFGVTYLGQSRIVATTTTGTLASGESPIIQTLNLFSSTAPTLTVIDASGTSSPEAGTAVTINATMPATASQPNMPLYFVIESNTTGYSNGANGGHFSNELTQIASTTSVASDDDFASAAVSFDVNTTANVATAYIDAFNSNPSPTGVATNNTAISNIETITTTAGAPAELKVSTYFNSGYTNKATAVVSAGTLYVDVKMADAYGNAVPASATTQVSLSTNGGLSVSIAYIASGASDTYNSGTVGSTTTIVFSATTLSSGSSYTISATASANGVALAGSTTVALVSKTPTLSLTAPTTITTGVPTIINGTATASPGVAVSGAAAVISTIEYSLNGAKNVTLVSGGTSTSTTFQFSLLLTGDNYIIVYAEDNAGNWVSQAVQVPQLPPGETFTTTSSGAPALFQFPNGGPESVATTFTNNGASSVSIIVVANVFTSAGIPETPSPSATATVAPGATATVYDLLNGFPPGTYTVDVNVYSLTYVSYSPTYTTTVTIS